jgi:hypothetical protein
MHGVAEDTFAGSIVLQPINTAPTLMAENTASKERSFAFIVL